MQDLRSMVAQLSGTDLAVAGHAVALAGWHQVGKSCTLARLQVYTSAQLIPHEITSPVLEYVMLYTQALLRTAPCCVVPRSAHTLDC